MSNRIRFNKYHVTNGEIKARVFYSISNRTDKRECVTIYARDYDRSLGKIFREEYKNETDSMTDYFDSGNVTLFADHPLYAQALERALSNQVKRE
jgi:hypothetical protein